MAEGLDDAQPSLQREDVIASERQRCHLMISLGAISEQLCVYRTERISPRGLPNQRRTGMAAGARPAIVRAMRRGASRARVHHWIKDEWMAELTTLREAVAGLINDGAAGRKHHTPGLR